MTDLHSVDNKYKRKSLHSANMENGFGATKVMNSNYSTWAPPPGFDNRNPIFRRGAPDLLHNAGTIAPSDIISQNHFDYSQAAHFSGVIPNMKFLQPSTIGNNISNMSSSRQTSFLYNRTPGPF